jgi:citrate lyase subunit beta/citryl-CoA lyase
LLVSANRPEEFPGPIDGPTVGSSHPQLQQASPHAVALVLTGELCLQPEQTPVINEEYSPSSTDIQWAVTFPADFETRGRVIRDGSDLARLGRAEEIRELATAFVSFSLSGTDPRSIDV